MLVPVWQRPAPGTAFEWGDLCEDGKTFPLVLTGTPDPKEPGGEVDDALDPLAAGAFMEFGNLAPNWKDVLRFSNRWGPIKPYDPAKKRYGTFQDWVAPVARMRQLVGVWLNLRKTPTDAPDHAALRDALVTSVNQELAKNLTFPQMVWNAQACVMMLVVQFGNLLGALYCAFARAVVEDTRFRKCEPCGGYFVIGEGKRADGMFCSTRCRMRAYRVRVRGDGQGKEAA